MAFIIQKNIPIFCSASEILVLQFFKIKLKFLRLMVQGTGILKDIFQGLKISYGRLLKMQMEPFGQVPRWDVHTISLWALMKREILISKKQNLKYIAPNKDIRMDLALSIQ